MGSTPPCNSVQKMAGLYPTSRQNTQPPSTMDKTCQGCAHGGFVLARHETACCAGRVTSSRGGKQGEVDVRSRLRAVCWGAARVDLQRCTLGRGMSRRMVQRQSKTANHLARNCPRTVEGQSGVCDEMNGSCDACFFSAAALELPCLACRLPSRSPQDSSCHYNA